MPSILHRYIADFSHLFFPHICAGCGTDTLENNNLLCPQCFLQLPETGFINQPGNTVERIFYGRLPVQHAGSAFYFTKQSLVQRLITELKYHRNRDMGVYLGKLLGSQLDQSQRFNDVDFIIPLPLNPLKQKKRGYNQAEEICKGIITHFKKPLVNNAVTRSVFTETQTHKTRIARWQTMEAVFKITQPLLLQDKHILLVDDIVTTGATLEACGEVILQVPGAKLSIATVAYTF